jgi:hypothetical protein
MLAPHHFHSGDLGKLEALGWPAGQVNAVGRGHRLLREDARSSAAAEYIGEPVSASSVLNVRIDFKAQLDVVAPAEKIRPQSAKMAIVNQFDLPFIKIVELVGRNPAEFEELLYGLFRLRLKIRTDGPVNLVPNILKSDEPTAIITKLAPRQTENHNGGKHQPGNDLFFRKRLVIHNRPPSFIRIRSVS